MWRREWTVKTVKRTSRGRPLRCYAFCAALQRAALAVVLVAVLQGSPAGAQDKVKIAVIGDSSADGLWAGFTRVLSHDSCLKTWLEFGRFARNGTGLTRRDKFNWVEEVSRINRSFGPNLFLISLGLNDRQAIVLPNDNQATEFGSPDWPARYREGISALVKSATADGANVIWVGLAAMRDSAANADAEVKNGLFASTIEQLGLAKARFLPAWTSGLSNPDKFSSYVPDKNGQQVLVRAADGVHFTPAGDELVARYLLPSVIAKASEKLPGPLSCQN
jgi:uncharacterized protein